MTTTTVLYGNDETQVDDAVVDGDNLWLRLDDLTRASGWELKREGACRGDVCVPIPSDHAAEFVLDDGIGRRFNLPALSRLLDAPVLVHKPTNTWCISEDAGSRSERMMSLEAPEFELPDIDGTPHRLTDYRGKKIFLLAWASW